MGLSCYNRIIVIVGVVLLLIDLFIIFIGWLFCYDGCAMDITSC